MCIFLVHSRTVLTFWFVRFQIALYGLRDSLEKHNEKILKAPLNLIMYGKHTVY